MNNEAPQETFKLIKKSLADGKYQDAFEILRSIADIDGDFTFQMKYASLLRSMISHLSLKKIRVAVLASSTASHFNDVLRFWLACEGFEAEIFEAEYSTIHQTIMDPQSGMYAFDPDILFLMTNYRDIKTTVLSGLQPDAVETQVQMAVNEFVALWRFFRQRSSAPIIQCNADLPYFRVLGNYENTVSWSHTNFLRQFNSKLTRAIEPGVVIFDLEFLASVYGRARWHEGRFWYHSKHPFALDATGLVAHELARTIGALKGTAKKCLVLDLDNTLWGGVIGDDGLQGIALGQGANGEAFVDFQRYLLKLKERGILLAVCSKNEESIAQEPFLKHPDMVLKLEDIVSFKANWNDKVSNIKEIAQELNIGLDAIVFVDDNPIERELVKECLPMVSTPFMPSDPSDFIHTLAREAYFETVSFSDEDRARSDLYRLNVQRNQFQAQFTDISGYLRGLEMTMEVESFDDFHLPRITQLINKSNQFHLTTTRYSESDITKMMLDKDKKGLYFKLKDRFGDNGLISVVILQKCPQEASLFIDTWVMSCRVLSRGVEEFICNEILEWAREQKCSKIIGKYIPTAKNKIVAELYKRLHFDLISDEQGITMWELPLTDKLLAYPSLIERSEGEK